MPPFALQQARCCSSRAVAGRPSTSTPLLPIRRCRPTPLTRPAAFGIGGGGNKKPSANNTSDAIASAAAEAEAAAAKVGEAAPSDAAEEALAAEVAAEAAEAGASASAGGGASSALSPAPAATSSLPPAPVRSAGAGRAQAAANGGKKGSSSLSLPQFARQLQQQQQQQRRPTTLAGRRARGFARVLLFAGVAYALLSLGAAVMKVARRANSPRAQRLRTVDRNKRVVESLNAVFLSASPSPSSDSTSASSSSPGSLTPALMRKLRSETGFTGSEVFRKYLWYLLRERRFDSTAVADLVALRTALELSDEEVAAALKERAQRIYDKYGNVMLDVAGMSKSGIERKATCRALFSKLLFLSEAEELFSEQQKGTALADIPAVFGATDDDAAKLRIVSLLEVDLGKLEDQFPSSESGGGFFGDQPRDDGGSGGGGGGGGGNGGGW